MGSDLLGKWGGGQRRLGELSDHNEGLIPLKEREKEGGLSGKSLRLPQVTGKCWDIQWAVFEQKLPIRRFRTGPALASPPFSVIGWEQHVGSRLCVDAVMDRRMQQLGSLGNYAPRGRSSEGHIFTAMMRSLMGTGQSPRQTLQF